MILYPTETIYALGVNALDERAVSGLASFKGRDANQTASWLVREVEDIERFAQLGEIGARIAKQFLPGPLTLVVAGRDFVPPSLRAPDGTIGFRISPDPVAQSVIADFMAKHDAPLTCTSANVSGENTEPTPDLILKQFNAQGIDASAIDRVVDDGPRSGSPSTVVRVIEGSIEILREGAISGSKIFESV